MPIINQLVVISKFMSNRNILSKTYELNENYKIIDVIVHAERLLSIDCRVFPSYVDINMLLGVYFIYYRDNSGKLEPSSFFSDENITIRICRDEFNPIPDDSDFNSQKFIPYIKNIKSKYDIDMDCKKVSIDVMANLVVNIAEERAVTIREEKAADEYDEMEEFDEIPLRSVAMTRNYYGGDIRNYAITLEELSKAINQKLLEMEKEKNALKKEIEAMEEDIKTRNHQYSSLNEKFNRLSREYSIQKDKLKLLEEKYLREQKKVFLLEAENNKKSGEINYLLNEKRELISNIEKNKSTIVGKIMQLINKK